MDVKKEMEMIRFRLQRELADKKISKTKIAKQYDVSRSNLYNIINGKVNLDVEFVLKLCKDHNLSFQKIIYGTEYTSIVSEPSAKYGNKDIEFEKELEIAMEHLKKVIRKAKDSVQNKGNSNTKTNTSGPK